MDFLITYVSPNLTSFVHEMVNNSCKYEERREIDYLCSQKTQRGLNSHLGNTGYWVLLHHFGGFPRKLLFNYYQHEVAGFQP